MDRTVGLVVLGLMCGGVQKLPAQAVHDIVMIGGDAATGRYRFSPQMLSVKPGDVLRFTVQSGAPHLLAFQSSGLTPAVRNALNGAMPDRTSDLRGPVLRAVGTQYRMVVPSLPPGTYHFVCLTHFAFGMSGAFVVSPPKAAGRPR